MWVVLVLLVAQLQLCRGIQTWNQRHLQSDCDSNPSIVDLRADCFDRLLEADVTEPIGKLDRIEYVQFANALSGDGLLEGDPPLSSLAPLLFQYNTLVCECARWPGFDQGCCLGFDAFINITGAEVNSIPSSTQANFLCKVCDLSYDAVDDLRTFLVKSSPPTPPSPLPTLSPHSSPFVEPSPFPSIFPSASPSIPIRETSFPASLPTASPQNSPILSPTSSPSIPPVPNSLRANGSFQFILGNSQYSSTAINAGDGGFREEVESAFIILAFEIVSEIFSQRRRAGRRLPVSVPVDASATCTFVDINCPGIAEIQPGTFCQNTVCEVPLDLEDENPAIVSAQFEQGMERAFNDGLLIVPSATYVGLFSGDTDSQSFGDRATEQNNNSIAIVVIISILTVLCLIGAVGLFVYGRRNNNKGKEAGMNFGEDDFNQKELLGATPNPAYLNKGHSFSFASHDKYEERSRSSSRLLSDRGEGEEEDRRSVLTRSASEIATGRVAVSGMETPEDSSSNAGSSGWSSSAGISSINTASIEDSLELENNHFQDVSTLAAMGAASAVAHRISAKEDASPKFVPVSNSFRDLDTSTLGSDTGSLVDHGSAEELNLPNSNVTDNVPKMPLVSRADLDSAIEAGDWAAVGATAALLVSATDSDSRSIRSSLSGSALSKDSTLSSSEMDRVAKLEELVDAGDWDGVVQAAARFDPHSDAGSSLHESTVASYQVTGEKSKGNKINVVAGADNAASASTDDKDNNEGNSQKNKDEIYVRATTRSFLGSGNLGALSSHSAGDKSDTPSKARRRTEIRTEVEALVRRVVPEEIDNVDAMMLQFHGREEELVATLRTMQERSIAQRARAAVLKSAQKETQQVETMSAMRGSGPISAGKEHSESGESRPPSNVEAGYSTSSVGRADSSLGGTTIGAATAASSVNRESVSTLTTSIVRDLESTDSRGAGAQAAYRERDNRMSPSHQGDSRRQHHEDGDIETTLDDAIGAGDWTAVGRVAATMGDASAESNHSDSEGELSDSVSSKNDGSRASKLDKMIAKGDWSGIVAATSRYSAADAMSASKKSRASDKVIANSSQSSVGRPSHVEAGEDVTEGSVGSKGSSWMGSKRQMKDRNDADHGGEDGPALNYEQQILAQEAMWNKIAKQSKSKESPGVSASASDAADWAIYRSLDALRSAEQGGELFDPDGSAQGTDTMASVSTMSNSFG